MADDIQRRHADGPGTQGGECAVCWMETDEYARLPCHESPAGSSMQYCSRCIEMICENGPGGVGRCPTCREFLRKAEGGGFEKADRVEICTLCRQARLIVGELRPGIPCCDSCFIGAQNPLRYECERCRRVQRIPHPMYRYQVDGPNAFGNNTWACQQRCVDFTHWRVYANDVHLVPPDDAPESWGVRDDWLAQVRAQRRRELAQGGMAARVGGAGAVGAGAQPAAAGNGRAELWQLVVPAVLLWIAYLWDWL